MKLKNKLLPLVGLGAVCATAIPLASCTKSAEESFVNLKEQYTPAEKLESQGYESIEVANNKYFGNSNFAKIFSEDYYWSTSLANYLINDSEGSEAKTDDIGHVEINEKKRLASGFESNLVGKAQAKVLPGEMGFDHLPANKRFIVNSEIERDYERLYDVKVLAKTLGEGEEAETVYCVSYKLDLEFEINSIAWLNIKNGSDIDGSLTYKSTVEVNNLPMTLAYGPYAFGSEVSQFYVKPNIDAMDKYNSEDNIKKPQLLWNMSQDVSYTITTNHVSTGTVSVTSSGTTLTGYRNNGSMYLSNYYETINSLFNELSDFTCNWFGSYYLYNCKLEK